MRPWALSDGSNTMKSEAWPMCRGRMHSRRWHSPGLNHTVYVHHSPTECPSTPQSTLWRHQSSRAWRCRIVSGSLARSTHDLSPAASRQFSMILGDTTSATCARISSLDAVWAATAALTMRQSWCASLLCGRPEPGLWVWECSTDHCWKQRHTIDTLCPTCSEICQYVHPASCRPTMRLCSNG